MEEGDPFGVALQTMIESSLQIGDNLIKGENIGGDIWEKDMKAAEQVFDGLIESFFGQLVSPIESREDSRSKTEASDSEDTSVPLLGANGHGVWRLEDAANGIVAHGEKLLLSEDTPLPQRRLARRLTALPQKAKPCLAYGCYVDHCLWKNHEVGALSVQCSTALEVAKATFHNVNYYENTPRETTSHTSLHSERNMEENDTAQNTNEETLELMEEEMEMMSLMMCFTGTLLLPIFMILFLRKISRHRRHRWMHMNPEKRRLRNNILTAVYENENIKSKVQEVVEMDLGEEIPLPPRCLDAPDQPQRSGCVKCLDKLFFSLPLASLAALLVYTSVTSPGTVLLVGGPAIGLMMVYIVLKSAYSFLTSCCIESEGSDFELQSREPLIEQSGGNDTGVCHNCDVQSLSNCGSCGCCVNCCNCKAEHDRPFIVML